MIPVLKFHDSIAKSGRVLAVMLFSFSVFVICACSTNVQPPDLAPVYAEIRSAERNLDAKIARLDERVAELEKSSASK